MSPLEAHETIRLRSSWQAHHFLLPILPCKFYRQSPPLLLSLELRHHQIFLLRPEHQFLRLLAAHVASFCGWIDCDGMVENAAQLGVDILEIVQWIGFTSFPRAPQSAQSSNWCPPASHSNACTSLFVSIFSFPDLWLISSPFYPQHSDRQPVSMLCRFLLDTLISSSTFPEEISLGSHSIFKKFNCLV